MSNMNRTDSGLGLVSGYGDIEEDDDDRREDDRGSGIDNISGSEDEDSNLTPVKKPKQSNTPPSKPQPPAAKQGMMRLVSYGADDLGDDDEEADASREEDVDMELVEEEADAEDPLINYDVSQVTEKSDEGIVIPPEPPGRCPRDVQDKIAKQLDSVRNGRDLNTAIEQNKEFRNPSIYEKLISFCGIDEKGTNYPPELYDPHLWGPQSFYDELAKTQRIEMEKREKDKKERTKVEFVAGVKKIDKGLIDQKRKTKWDTQPQAMKPSVITTTAVNPPVISVTTSASGAKTTVISAIGTIKKKR